MDVGAKTVVLLSTDDEGSVEADDMAAKDSDENNAAQEGEENVLKEKKRAGRKRKKTVYSLEEGEENELVSEKNWESDHEKNWEGAADVEEGGFSSGCVRKRERPRKIKSLKENYISDLEEDVKKKGKRGRKKKVIIEISDENDEAEQEEENVKTEKKKPGRKRKEIFSSGEEYEAKKEGGNVKKEKKKPGRKSKVSYSSEENDEDEQERENGKKVKIDENELISEKNLESEVLSDDSKGYSLRTDRKVKAKSIEQPKQKINKRNPKWIEEESLMCHQCQRNDKGRVVRCTKCKRKRFCITCLNKWYPRLKEEEIAEACPVCCGNCNCKACLRSCALIKENKMKTETNNNHEFELSKYMLKELLPYLRRLDEEKMVEKEIEAKRQGAKSKSRRLP